MRVIEKILDRNEELLLEWKETLCGIWFNHMQKNRPTEDASGKSFRYVKSCHCGKYVTKSVPIHDNDLLREINLNENNFPIDEKESKLKEKEKTA